MSEHVEGLNRDQTLLFPETLEKYVNENNSVRFIDAFVDSLNLEKNGLHTRNTSRNRQAKLQSKGPA